MAGKGKTVKAGGKGERKGKDMGKRKPRITAIICEKPSAAKRIAEVLSDGNYSEHEINGVSFYQFRLGGRVYRTVAAVGHLFSLKQVSKGWDYPKFDVEWIPSYMASKRSLFSKKYYDALQKAIANADEFIVATDYDEEGEVIGLNIIRFMAGRENAKRMKFSTMTKDELKDAFRNLSSSMDFRQAESGLTRHYLDWFYGINSTRALTLSLKRIGERFRILSAGRVQAPVLAMLAEREKEILAFKPEKYWEIHGKVDISGEFPVEYSGNPIKDKRQGEKVLSRIGKTKKAVVDDIKVRRTKQKPPFPYDTTTFMADAYRYFGYSPKQALDIAEELYQKGYISYPRTSSQQLPDTIDFRTILKKLSSMDQYRKAVRLLEGKELRPSNGKKTDPAHPAIYPTGEIPKRLGSRQRNIYDLIVRRFLATFGDVAERESMTIRLSVNGEVFILRGKRTVKKGWTELYGKYAKLEEIKLPSIEKGMEMKFLGAEMVEKETQPPQRYSQGSVLKEMEKRGLGTKATRASIIQTLYDRGYIVGKSIEVTELGLKVAEALKKHIPEIVSEELTRKFEEKTDLIQQGSLTMDEVLEEAKKELTKIFRKVKGKEEELGRELTEALKETQEKSSVLGKCPNCGGTLKMMYSWRTRKRFVGCSGYPDCKTGYPLPAVGRIEATGKSCESCGTPIIRVFRSGKRPFQMCLDPECETKKDWGKEKDETGK